MARPRSYLLPLQASQQNDGPRRGCPTRGTPPGAQADTFWRHLWISFRRLLRTPLPNLWRCKPQEPLVKHCCPSILLPT